MKHTILFSMIIAMAFVSAACGASTTAPATNTPTILPPAIAVDPGRIDPCKLVTPEEIKAALNETAGVNQFSELVDKGSICRAFIATRMLLITVRQFDAAEIESAAQDLKKQAQGGQLLSGIGDFAIFLFQDKTLDPKLKAGIIYLMKGKFSLIISLTDANLNPQYASDALKSLAQKAVARLP